MYALPEDPDVETVPALVVNKLDYTQLPTGISRVFVELVGNALAVGVRVPVLVARGEQDGPVFGLTAGVHGNELNGIPVIHELFRRLDVGSLRGTVIGVVAVNVPGLLRQQRGYLDGSDLNRIMPGDPNGNVAQVYAHRVLDRLIAQFDFLLDLHTASFGRVNSLYVRADMTNPHTAAMAYLQRPQIIVHNAAADHTLRGAAMVMGIPAITVEIGDPQRWQAKYTEAALNGALAVLDYAGAIDWNPDDGDDADETPAICSSSRWMYTDRGGLLEVYPALRDRLTKGQLVATVHNAFGDPIRQYRAPAASIVVGKTTNPIGYTGARILHLGRIASDDAGFVAAADCPRRAEIG